MDDNATKVLRKPAWLDARYIALAAELERMHGAAFAATFLRDIGVVPDVRSCDGHHRLVEQRRLDARQRTNNDQSV